MAILFCRKCGYFREVRSEYTGKSVACPQCRQTNAIHDTVEFFKRIIEKYRAQNRAFRKLKEQLSPANSTESTRQLHNLPVRTSVRPAEHEVLEP